MTGRLPAETPPISPTRRVRAPWTLRRRLVLAVVAMLALVSLGIGAVSVTILRASLMDNLDRQLVSAASRSNVVLGGRPGAASDVLTGPSQPPGTLALVYDGSSITAGYTDDTGTVVGLSEDQVRQLFTELNDAVEEGDTSVPFSVDLGADVGEYRVLAATARPGILYLIGLPVAGVTGTTTELAIIIALVSLAGIVLVAFLATAIVRLALRPLQRVTDTAASVAELPLDRGEVPPVDRVPLGDTDPRTEVGRVGSAVNRMLDHVDLALETRQASENKVRRFVADASHELRTPLASIRGYAELTRRSGQELPPDASHAIGRIEAESVRMTGLVEDLLLLARLDEGRELERKPVDLTRLLVDVVSDAHAAGPDHTWDLDLAEEPVLAAGDGPRLHQVFANLLTNARVHTDAGTRVQVALGTEGDRAVVTVTDDGPGIPESLRATLFERFARGDSSRFRGAGGSTGLGLAIVRAVVAAHQGEVSVDSRPGRTSFRVTLPLAG